MKRSGFMKIVAIMVFAMAIPSIAAAQYGEARLDNWLDGHQDVKAELARDPNLIYDRKWRHEHPGLQEFMQNHPQVWGKIPNSGRYGAYGPDNHWHDADWWHQNNPAWINQNHPEWTSTHPGWGGPAAGVAGVGPGDYDEHHVWHDSGWWSAHHPDWVNAHHPEWYKHPYEHPIAAEEHHEDVVHAEEMHHHPVNPGQPNHH